MAKEKTTSVTVVATQNKRWRAGMEFGREPRTVEVTEDQLARLKDDPMLVVVKAPTPIEDPKKS